MRSPWRKAGWRKFSLGAQPDFSSRGQFVYQHLEHPVGPSKADFVRAVPVPDFASNVRRPPLHVVFLQNLPGPPELLMHHAQELLSDPVRVVVIPVAPQPLHGDQFERCPTERRIPLIPAAIRAGPQSAWPLELPQRLSDT